MTLPAGMRRLSGLNRESGFRFSGPVRFFRRSKGFTLIELALVTVLLLVIIGLSAPQIKRTLSGFAANDAALNAAKLISYAQERAIIERRYYRVKFDAVNGRYRLFDSYESGGRLIYREVTGRFGRVFSLPEGLSIAPSAGEITLYPDGTCDEFSFTVRDSYGSGYLVRIKGFGTSFDMREIRVEKQ